MQLNLAHNALKKMPAGVPNSLIQLFLDRNRIDDIPKQVYSAHVVTWPMNTPVNTHCMHYLTLVVCQILQLFFSLLFRDYFGGFNHLAFVRLNHNQLSDKGLPKLVFNISTLLDLQLSHNQIASVPLFNGHLEHLHLDHNTIESKLSQQQSAPLCER